MVEEGAWTHCRAARQRVMIGSAMSTIVTRLMATLSCLGTTCVPCEGCAMGTCVPRVSHVMGPYESPATHPGVSPRRQLMVEGTSGDTYNCPTINSRSKPRRRAICHSQFAHRSSTLMSPPAQQEDSGVPPDGFCGRVMTSAHWRQRPPSFPSQDLMMCFLCVLKGPRL